MAVIRKNGKMVAYFNSISKPKNNSQILTHEQFDDETELVHFRFREWQKNLVEDSQARIQRNEESKIKDAVIYFNFSFWIFNYGC